MPNLINVLRPAWEEESGEKMTDEERRKQIEKSLKKSDANKDEKRGMEWGTCLIFSCGKDCCLENGKDAKEVWREEVVFIQWDV
jgi:pre-rRNA-processing protein TSR4